MSKLATPLIALKLKLTTPGEDTLSIAGNETNTIATKTARVTHVFLKSIAERCVDCCKFFFIVRFVNGLLFRGNFYCFYLLVYCKI